MIGVYLGIEALSHGALAVLEGGLGPGLPASGGTPGGLQLGGHKVLSHKMFAAEIFVLNHQRYFTLPTKF